MREFDVRGMSCGHCARAITGSIREIDPAAEVEVDLAGQKVRVESRADGGKLLKAIEDAGYEARPLAA